MSRWPAEAHADPPPTSSRIRAAVLTPTPGMEVRTRERGWASSIRSTPSPIDFVAEESLSVNQQVLAARFQGPQSRNDDGLRLERGKMSATSLAGLRGAFFAVIAASVRFPAVRIPAGPPQREKISSTAGCVIRSPRHFRGWMKTSQQSADTVADPGGFPERSSSRPTSTPSSASVSSPVSTRRIENRPRRLDPMTSRR